MRKNVCKNCFEREATIKMGIPPFFEREEDVCDECCMEDKYNPECYEEQVIEMIGRIVDGKI